MATNNNVLDPNKKVVQTDPVNGNAAPGSTPAATIPVTSLTEEEKAYYDNLYTKGGYTQDLQESIAHGGTTTPQKYFDGTEGWYTYDSAERPYYADDADATFLSGSGYYETTQNKNKWHELEEQKKIAKNAGRLDEVARIQAEQDALHAANEQIRAQAGYSGGVNGSMYYQLPDANTGGAGGSYGGSYGKTPGASGYTSNSQSDLKGLLDAWQDAAIKQQNGQIDYAVAKAVADLERALADAQPQFKEQAESVDRSARQAMDNAALYAEMRGDKGGIGQEQYNSIQNTQAQNHLTVQQAQTKLATDTQRQIADLRAQGEFEKADAALQITQQYLQQLIGLEQWAAEYNLSVDQFNESIRQWEAEYNMAMQQLQIGQNQWQAEYEFKQQQYADSLTQYEQSQLSGMGQALLNAGIMPDDKQLAAMGMTKAQAQDFITAQQLASKAKGGGTGNNTSQDYTGLFEAAKASGNAQSYIANNYKKFGFTSSSGLYNDYKNWSDSGDGDEVTMTLTTAKDLAKNGIFNDTVLAVLHDAGYDDTALGLIYGYDPNASVTPTVTPEQQAKNYETLKSHIQSPNRGITLSNIAYMIESALSSRQITKEQANELLDLMDAMYEKGMGK